VPKLPAPREEDLSNCILDAIDMDIYRVEKQAPMQVPLPDKDAEIEPHATSEGGGKPEPKPGRLSNIIKAFKRQLNSIASSDAGRVHQLITVEILAKVAADTTYLNAKKHSDRQNARIEHDKALAPVMTAVLKHDVFAFGSMNDVKRIETAFKDYYRTTILRDERDPNKLRARRCTFRLTAPAGWNGRSSAAPGGYRPSGPHGRSDRRRGMIAPKIIARPGIARPGGFQVAPKVGCRVVPAEGRLAMKIDLPDIPNTLQPAAELDRLGDEIAELSAHLEAATARLLDLIRDFDARGGWNTGFRSCAAWLSWRVGLDLGAAREKVRVARALGTLPLLAQALARGELSYAKVRALTRVATPETEERLLGVARAGTAAHVERIVRGWRRVDRHAEARETARQHAGRALHVHQDEDGMVALRGRLTPEVGALLLRALAAARETLYQRGRSQEAATRPAAPSADPPTMAQQQADALALLAETALHHGIDPGAPGERYQVVVHVDAPALADPDQPGQSVLEDGAHVSAETSRRLACDASRVVMRHDEDGRVVEIGARTRTIPPALRRALPIGIAAAASRAAESLSARDITSATGRKGARPRCRTSRSSVAGTTAPSTRKATKSIDSPTAHSGSGGRTAGPCPRSRPRPRCPPIRSRAFARSTTRRGCACTRKRRARGGWGSAWIWAGRSTSCILWPREPRERDDCLRRQIVCVTESSSDVTVGGTRGSAPCAPR